MNLNGLNINDVQELLQFAPLAEQLAEQVVGAAMPILAKLKPAFDAFDEHMMDRRIYRYKKYIEAGIAPEQAIALVINDDSWIAKGVEGIKIRKE